MDRAFERAPSRLDDKNFIAEIRVAFADAILEEVTEPDPRRQRPQYSEAAIKKIMAGERVEASDGVSDKLVRVGQDFRLTPDEIDRLKEIFLK
jgi:hypothetical protein